MYILKTLIIISTLLFVQTVSFADNKNTGTVAETMTSGGYVYVRLKEDNTWVASTSIPIVVGDKVRYSDGNTMKDFHSRKLNRSFDFVIFAQELEVINQVDADKHASAETNDPHAVKMSAKAEAPVAGEITPLKGGKTIVEVQSERDQLKDQKIALRARVMNVSENIAGKNWVTLQDGTGTEPNNKLIATTSELVTVGDLVTVTGVIHTDVDLGSGYVYSVLLEEAKFNQ